MTGADTQVVKNSLTQLNGTKSVLDLMSAPAAITSWRVDEKSNSVVVEVNKNVRDAASDKWIATAKSISGSVQVAEVTESPTPLYDLRGGEAIYMGGGRCSLGFSVTGGYVTAGHCGTTGTAVSGSNRVAQGSFAGSVFPGNDYAWVRTNANWTPRPWVNRSGSNVVVKGSTQAAVGSQICRSGSTTGWRCGTVQAFNQTVNYPQGQVRGLTRTNACAEGGDSGGSWVAGSGFGQAQGVHRPAVRQLLDRRHHVLPAREPDPVALRLDPHARRRSDLPVKALRHFGVAALSRFSVVDEHDLAVGVPGLAQPVGVGASSEREDLGRRNGERALLGECRRDGEAVQRLGIGTGTARRVGRAGSVVADRSRSSSRDPASRRSR